MDHGNFFDDYFMGSTEEQTSLYQAILNSIIDGLAIFDAMGCVRCIHQKDSVFNFTDKKNIDECLEEMLSCGLGPRISQLVFSAVRERERLQIEAQLSPDGNWYEMQVLPFYGGVLFFYRKVPDNKYLLLTDNTSDIIYQAQISPQLKFIFISPSIARISGYAPEEFYTNPEIIYKIVHPEDIALLKDVVRSPGRNQGAVIRWITREGTVLWIEHKHSSLSCDGKDAFFQGIARDVTKRIKAEKALRESEERFRTAVENMPDCFAIFSAIRDDQGKIVDFLVEYVNDVACKSIAKSKEMIVGKNLLELLPGLRIANLFDQYCGLLDSGLPVDSRELVFNDVVEGMPVEKILEIKAAKIGDGFAVSWNNVTEKKKIEKELLLSVERFNKAFNTSINLMSISRVDGVFVEINHSFTRITGYEREETLGRTPDELGLWANPEDREKIYGVLSGQGYIRNYEMFLLTHKGELRYGLFSADYFESGGQKYILSTFCDLTRRKQAEEAIVESERFMNSVFDCIRDRLYVIDKDFNIIRTNIKSGESFTKGLFLEGEKCYRVFNGSDKVCEGCPGVKTLKSGLSGQATVRNPAPEGKEYRWYDTYCYPFIDEAKGAIKGVIAYSRDITEKLKIEKEMARLDQFNLVGQMAAGIGHEIRNPMTSVRGFLQLLGAKEDCDKYRDYLTFMIGELDRANLIITEFLSLTKTKSEEKRPLNLNTILSSLLPLINADAVNANKSIVMDLAQTPDIMINEKEIRQLILNFVRNGLDAMADGGKLTISTRMDNGEVVLSVQDQGRGIKKADLKKLGTPFFTTKDEGTGLGLAICYSIASRHAASIEVKTGSRGTVFSVRFIFK